MDTTNVLERPRSGAWRLLANVGWLSVDQFLRLGCGLVIGVAIARALGPARFGMLNYATAASAFCAVIAALGLDSILQRDLVKAPPGEWNKLLGTSFLLRLLAGFAAFCIYSAIILFTTADNALRQVCIIIGIILLFGPLAVFDLWFQSQTLAKYSVYARDAAFLLATGARVALLWRGTVSVIALAWLTVFETAFGGLLLASFYFRGGSNRHGPWRWEGTLARTWLTESWTLLLSGLAIFVYMRIDQIMLQKMLGSHAVGVYSAAIRISEIGYFVPLILASTLLPSVVRSREHNHSEYLKRRQRYFDLSAILSFVIALPTCMLAPWLTKWLYGPAFNGAADILIVHAWATVFVFTGVARGQYLLCEGLLRFSFYATVCGAVLNIFLNLILIPRFGGLGAAYATLIAYGVSAFVSSFFSQGSRPIGQQQLSSLILPLAVLRLAKAASRT